MRHNKKFNHLGRTHSHRAALLANMTISLIMHKRIFTTLAKAKALRVYAEPLINRAKEISQELIKLRERFLTEADRPGGYTRILKTGNRLGDNAKTCFIELVDYNENMLKEKGAAKKSRTRRSRKSATPAAEAPAAPAAEGPEAPAAE